MTSNAELTVAINNLAKILEVQLDRLNENVETGNKTLNTIASRMQMVEVGGEISVTNGEIAVDGSVELGRESLEALRNLSDRIDALESKLNNELAEIEPALREEFEMLGNQIADCANWLREARTSSLQQTGESNGK